MEQHYEIDRELSIECELFDQYNHIDILYDLLLKRKYPISHRVSISKKEHAAFCQSYPYLCWYVVFIDKKPMGSFYLTDKNSIGINLKDEYVRHADKILQFVTQTFLPLPAIPSVRPGHFYCNLNPENHDLINAVKEMGGKLFQVSYSFEKVRSDG